MVDEQKTPKPDSKARKQALSRLGSLKQERATWLAHWQEITAYIKPHHGRFFVQDRNRGTRRFGAIYDNTGTRALRILSAGLMGGLTSPARPWFRLTTSDPDLAKFHSVKVWMDGATQLMLEIFQRSNTYRMLHNAYEELGAFGTAGAIMADDFDNVIHHHSLTAGEYCIATDWKGEVCTMYREFEKPVSEVVKEFGLENVSKTVKNLYDTGSLDAWVPLMHVIEPRADRDPSKGTAKNMPWKSVYWELNGDSPTPLRESGYKTFPGLFPRWQVTGGDIYGNSPAMEALGDVKQLQQEQLRKSQGIDYMTNPPLQVPNSLKNREVDRLPGGVTYYDAATQTGGVKSMFDVRLDLNHLLADIQDVRMRIDSAFYADLFRMISNNPNDPRMTATEVAARQEEKMLMIGPVLERLHNELLAPLVERTFARMISADLLPPPPQELQGQDLNIELVSVLAQAQKSIATNGIDRFTMAIGQMSAIFPEVKDNFDADQWAQKYSDMLSVDPNLIVASDKVALVRQQRAQQQAAQQQSAMANQAADTANKLGNTPTQNGNNALGDVMRGLTGYT